MGKTKDVNDVHPTPDELDNFISETMPQTETSIVDDAEIKVMNELNNKHIFISNMGGKSWITDHIYSEVSEREELTFVTVETFKNMYMNKTIQISEKYAPTHSEYWLKSPLRNSVDGVLFDPAFHTKIVNKGDRKYLNLWSGFNVEPKKGNWSRTLRHIYKILCKSDSVKFIYFMKWLAWAVQNPDKQAEVAIILKGEKGTGKSFLFVQMKKVFGQHGMVITDHNRLTGKHTGHFRSLSFLFCDEVYYPGDKAIEGRIKAIVTEPYLDVEGKFMDAVSNKNRLHICMSTNNEWVIPATKDERRYYIDTVDNRFAKGTASNYARQTYFNKLWGEMDNGGREAMLYDLLNMKLDDWHPRDDVPETKELDKQRGMSLNAIEQAIRTMLEDGVFHGEYDKLTYWISAEDLTVRMEKIEPYCAKFSSVRKATLIKELGAVKGRVPGKGNIRWEFPTLKQMRRNWDIKYGRNEWDEQTEWTIVKTEY